MGARSVIGCGRTGFKNSDKPNLPFRKSSIKPKKDIVPEPVEPGGVHPELGGQVDSQGQSAVHGVVEESPAERRRRRRSHNRTRTWPLIDGHSK